MCPTDGIATKEMIYKEDNLLIWNMFNQNIELDPSLGVDYSQSTYSCRFN